MAEATKKRASKPAGGKGAAPPDEHAPPTCTVGFCPICLAVTTVNEARPDVIEHLMVAGREVLLAVRAIIDSRLQAPEHTTKLERLTIE